MGANGDQGGQAVLCLRGHSRARAAVGKALAQDGLAAVFIEPHNPQGQAVLASQMSALYRHAKLHKPSRGLQAQREHATRSGAGCCLTRPPNKSKTMAKVVENGRPPSSPLFDLDAGRHTSGPDIQPGHAGPPPSFAGAHLHVNTPDAEALDAARWPKR